MKTFRREASTLFLWAVLMVLPVYVGFKYTDIIIVKHNYFLLVFGLYLVCGIVTFIWSILYNRSMGISIPTIKEIAGSLSPLDWSMAAFGVIVLLSSLTSRFTLKNTFFADQSQYVGGLIYLSIVVCYFLLSRYADPSNSSYVAALYISSLFVFIIGLINHARLDPLGMHKDNVTVTFDYMASTIGNVDYYYGYMVIVMLFFAAYRADMKWDWKAVAVDVLLVVCYINFWTSQVGGCYIGVFFGILLLVIMGMTSFERFKNLFWQGFIAGIAGMLAEVIYHFNDNIYFALDNYTSGLLQLHHFWLPLGIICFIVWIILTKKQNDDKYNRLMEFLSNLIKPALILLSGIIVFFYGMAVFIQKVQEIAGRLYIWDDLRAAHSLITFREKLLGVGPGCLDLILIDLGIHNSEDMAYLTAHNEVFEYWFILGVLGVVVYLAIYVSFFMVLFSEFKKEINASDNEKNKYFRELCCCGILFITYLGQGVTNGPYISTIVIAYIFLSMMRRYQIPDEDII